MLLSVCRLKARGGDAIWGEHRRLAWFPETEALYRAIACPTSTDAAVMLMVSRLPAASLKRSIQLLQDLYPVIQQYLPA